INTLTPLITYLFCCNSDTTSLLSGTAIKAIVAYVSDYVTKPGLKTYSIFDTIRQIFNRNTELTTGSIDCKSAARSLMIKIVNALTAKMEIGSPMACLYIFGFPDHYTDHMFVSFYWRNYVQEVQSAWVSLNEEENPLKLFSTRTKLAYQMFKTICIDHLYKVISICTTGFNKLKNPSGQRYNKPSLMRY
ncbi:hypothetical protein L208DRAFT_1275948, partial [Tricholoma matsutake]